MGCALYLTGKDYKQIEDSIKSISPAMKSFILKNYKTRLKSINSTSKEKVEDLHKSRNVNSRSLIRALGNSRLSIDHAKFLSNALANIAGKNENAMKLFNQVHNASWSLESVNSLAYKVEATSRLLSKSAGNLHIKNNDTFTIGSHLKSQYPPDTISSIADSLFPTKDPAQPDITIHRGGADIGVDFKYRATDSSCVVSKGRLEVIADNIKAGQFDGFHIVSNSRFSAETVETVNELNAQLKENGKPEIELHGYVKWPP